MNWHNLLVFWTAVSAVMVVVTGIIWHADCLFGSGSKWPARLFVVSMSAFLLCGSIAAGMS